MQQRGRRKAYISGLHAFIHFQRSAGFSGSSALVAFARLPALPVASPSVDLRFLAFLGAGAEADAEGTIAGCVALGV